MIITDFTQCAFDYNENLYKLEIFVLFRLSIFVCVYKFVWVYNFFWSRVEKK